MLDPWHPYTPGPDAGPTAVLKKRRKKRSVIYRIAMVFVWLLSIAIAFGAGTSWMH